MNSFTTEQKRVYMKNDGNICPICQSENISFEDREYYGKELMHFVNCKDCGISWTDVYTLTDVILDDE